MVRDLARKLLGPRAIILDLRRAGDRGDDVGDGHRRETVSPEKPASFSAEQVQMARTARVRSLARRRDQRAADSAPAHRFIHVQRTYQRRVDLRLDADHSDRFIADIRKDVTRGWPFDSVRHHAGPREHVAHVREVTRLLDYEFACAMPAYCHGASRERTSSGAGKSGRGPPRESVFAPASSRQARSGTASRAGVPATRATPRASPPRKRR